MNLSGVIRLFCILFPYYEPVFFYILYPSDAESGHYVKGDDRMPLRELMELLAHMDKG